MKYNYIIVIEGMILMLKILKYFRWYYWIFLVFIIGLLYLQVSADLEMPNFLTEILNNAGKIAAMKELGIEAPIELINQTKDEIWVSGRGMIICALISVSSTIVVSLITAKMAAGFSHDLRRKIYEKIQNFSLAEIDEFSTASLITRSTNDITQVQMIVVFGLRIAISAPIMAISGIIKATNQASSSNLNYIVIGSVIGLVLLVFTLFMIVMPKFKRIQGLTDKLNLTTRENLTGIRVVRASNAQEYEENKFNDINDDITKTNVFVNRVMSLMQPGMMILMNITSLLILWLGAYAIDSKILQIGDVFGFQQYTMIICMAFMQLIAIFIMVPRGQVSASRINAVLDSKNLIEDPIISKNIAGNGSLEFKNVTFGYSDSEIPVLEDITFKVNPGETLAIIGGTGSGKTTVLNLLNRFFDPIKGEILVDGINIKDVTQHELHQKIGFIPQKSNLFIGTIESNLRFGKADATIEEIDEALKIAQAYEFISKLNEGINSKVAQGGANFSGGQKQRLCIARALIKKPEILAFDDSFSALDLKTDKLLRDALNESFASTTKIIVAQRIGTILNADTIIVLDDGKIAGIGKHNELLKTCTVYQEIAYSQLSKEELENAANE